MRNTLHKIIIILLFSGLFAQEDSPKVQSLKQEWKEHASHQRKELIGFINFLYDQQFLKKELEMIADYYYISKRKKTKIELIQDIVLYETDPTNFEIVEKRKLMWFYLNELKTDRYLKKFIIFK